MTDSSRHPMLREIRPMIVTQPINRVAGDSKNAIERGDRGLPIFGLGRSGKTWALNCLAMLLDWRPFPMAFFAMDYGTPGNATETYFSASVLSADSQRIIHTATGVEGMARAGNLLLERTKHGKEIIVAFVINEANRFTTDELEHLVTLDNKVERAGKRLFCILNYQSDAKTKDGESIEERLRSQHVGRFYSAAHGFTGLLWGPKESMAPDLENCDVTMAFDEYQHGNFVPLTEACPCLAHFASSAWARGYRITSQIGLIREIEEDFLTQHGLPIDAPWPMQAFDRFVYYLFVRIAGQDPGFREFKKEQILAALVWSGLLELLQSYYPVR